MARRGRRFEKFVEALTSLEQKDDAFKAESPARLLDRVTGEYREIDVLLTRVAGNKQTRIGIECKEHSRPIDVKEIEAYAGKLQDLDIDHGVVVSREGFTRGAIVKAGNRRLSLQTLNRSEEFDWLQTAGILTDSVRFDRLSVIVPTAHDKWGECTKLLGVDGLPIREDQIYDAAAAYVFGRFGDPAFRRSHSNDKDVLNTLMAPVRGVSRAFTERGQVNAADCRIKAVFVFSRSFQTWGYFLNRGNEANRAARARFYTSGDEVRDLVVSEAAPDRVAITRGDGSKLPGSYRQRISLTTWAEVGERLREVGNENHLVGLSAESDRTSVGRWFHENGDRWSGEQFDPERHGWANEPVWIEDSAADIHLRDPDAPPWQGPSDGEPS